jgi:hypothetical protein
MQHPALSAIVFAILSSIVDNGTNGPWMRRMNMFDPQKRLDDDSFNLEGSGIWELNRVPAATPDMDRVAAPMATPEFAPKPPRTTIRELLRTVFHDVD